MKWPGAPASSNPLTLEPQKSGPSQQPNAPVDRESGPVPKILPVDAMPAAWPSVQMPKRPAIKALRAGKSLPPKLSASKPQVYPPQERLGQTPALIRVPSAPPGSSANVALPGRAASFGTPRAGALGNAGPPPKAPAPSVHATAAMGSGFTAKGTRPAAMNRVASVGLPPTETGLLTPKRPVAPISPKLEIVPRPATERENCGDDGAFIACPTLQTRPEVSIPSEGPEATLFGPGPSVRPFGVRTYPIPLDSISELATMRS
jgi:hypothetical protein